MSEFVERVYGDTRFIGQYTARLIADPVRELHVPADIPEGMVWMGARADHPEDRPCAGCQTGDPYVDNAWPCATADLVYTEQERAEMVSRG
jgi:hypothetical protein